MTKTLTTWANRVSSDFEKAMQNAIGCFSEYLENASYAEPDSKGRMPWDLEEHYLINNILGTIWQQIYGNTTNTTGNPDPKANLEKDYFKAVHAKARAEKAFADYILLRPECDETNPRMFLPEVAAEDTRFNQLDTEKKNAELRFDRLNSLFYAHLELYQTLFEDTWNYKPYNVTGEKNARTMTAQQQANAAKYKAMANRNSGTAPEAANG